MKTIPREKLTMKKTDSGYTILEMMIAVGVIGILAMLALPSFIKSRATVQDNSFISDLRVITSAFEEHAIVSGNFPPAATPGVVPNGMEDYLRPRQPGFPIPDRRHLGLEHRIHGC